MVMYLCFMWWKIGIGLSTSGYLACPLCGPSLVSSRPALLNKVIYENHHRFLPCDHPLFKPSSRGIPPHPMSIGDWEVYWNGVMENKGEPPKGISRYSIFFRLPYWRHLKVNHLLDPMHIFKNVASNIWDHLIGARDSLRAREDLKSINRLPSTWPRESGNEGKIILPKAPWILSKEEERKVKHSIGSIRTPTGFMHSLKGAFTTTKTKGSTKLYGLKSHDWHKMLQVFILCTFTLKACKVFLYLMFNFHMLVVYTSN